MKNEKNQSILVSPFLVIKIITIIKIIKLYFTPSSA